MSEIEQIIAEERKILGTGNSRAIRKEGKVPGIIYGDKKEPTLISIDNKIIKKLLEKPGSFSRQFEIKIGNKKKPKITVIIFMYMFTLTSFFLKNKNPINGAKEIKKV